MEELYPELIDYIFQNCWKYYSEVERKAIDHHFGATKFGKYPDNIHPKIDEAKKRFSTTDKEALKLLENGFVFGTICIISILHGTPKDSVYLRKKYINKKK